MVIQALAEAYVVEVGHLVVDQHVFQAHATQVEMIVSIYQQLEDILVMIEQPL